MLATVQASRAERFHIQPLIPNRQRREAQLIEVTVFSSPAFDVPLKIRIHNYPYSVIVADPPRHCRTRRQHSASHFLAPDVLDPITPQVYDPLAA